MKNLLVIINLLIGVVLVTSGMVHLANPFFFARSVDAYQLLGRNAVFVVAGLLPTFQVVLGLILIMGGWKQSASIAAALLFFVFSSAQVYALATGLEITCGCFGYDTNEISLRTIMVPLVCLVFSVLSGMVLSDDDRGSQTKSNGALPASPA